MSAGNVTRRYRAVPPDGGTLADYKRQQWPTWNGQTFTEAQVMEMRDEYYPGWLLQVEETIVMPWQALGDAS